MSTVDANMLRSTPGTSLVVREVDTQLRSIEQARAALANIQALSEAKDISDKAAAAATYYAKAKETRDLMNRAIELRIWAERRAGELALATGSNGKELRESLGLNSGTLTRWLLFARVRPRALEAAIAHYYDNGRDLTLIGVEKRVGQKNAKRVERGIYEMPDGRYLLRWRRHGVSHKQTVARDINSARHRLRVVRGLVEDRPTSKRGTPDLRVAYQNIRTALATINDALPVLAPQARREASDAQMRLYAAEDAISRAIRANELATEANDA